MTACVVNSFKQVWTDTTKGYFKGKLTREST